VTQQQPESARDEDRTAQFVRLLKMHERRLSGYVLSLVSNWADADEIIQDTSVRLWEQFEKFDPATDFGSWACAIAHYQILTYRRRQGRERARFSDEFAGAVADELAAEAPQISPRHHALAACLEKVTPAARAMVRAFYSGEATVADLAAKDGRSESSIYKWIATTRHFLHDCVERELREEGDA
jgi:RNA polymerase sigma-70 factor (ECF subfamily)